MPQRGNIILISFYPQSAREQAGHRPSLVISRIKYNRLVKLALVCPINSNTIYL
ncbi:MAG: hypothetical protein F6K54_31150 [Okeania sp. SIO3B5]|uniref:type II toxin-antitoxin system PemK/MazF family toxin n=1 Tax=Okeania sp. SIO3B5 TaxID=2607811 RepID=UPI00140093D5|nr:hypothetical protein [Okeania sp. SIO3B5]